MGRTTPLAPTRRVETLGLRQVQKGQEAGAQLQAWESNLRDSDLDFTQKLTKQVAGGEREPCRDDGVNWTPSKSVEHLTQEHLLL